MWGPVRAEQRDVNAISGDDEDASIEGVLVGGMLLPQRPASPRERQRPGAYVVRSAETSCSCAYKVSGP
jgi:hypothetical protein